MGNITNLTLNKYDDGSSTLYQDVWTYHYTGGNNRLDSVDATDTSPTSDRYFAYDANGNLKSDSKRQISNVFYYRKNKPYFVSNNTNDISYLHNLDDNKIFKIVASSSDTIYEYDLYSGTGTHLGTRTVNSDTTWRWHVMDSKRFATVTPSFNQNPNYFTAQLNSEGTFYVRSNDTIQSKYYVTDHLGNVRIAYIGKSDNGSINKTISYMAHYYPFGKVLTEYQATNQERFGFNGMDRDYESCDCQDANYITKFRRYDPELGRWWQIDPVTHHQYSPYSAIDNNPILLTDPSGSDSKIGWPSWGSIWSSIKSNFKAGWNYGTRWIHSPIQSSKDLWRDTKATWSKAGNYFQSTSWGDMLWDGAKYVGGKTLNNFSFGFYSGNDFFNPGNPLNINYVDTKTFINDPNQFFAAWAFNRGAGAGEAVTSVFGFGVGGVTLKVAKKIPQFLNNFGNSSHNVFRVVSDAEEIDISKFGFRAAPGAYEGKLFWTNINDAQWYKNWAGQENNILKIKVKGNFNYEIGLDAGRTFKFVDGNQLKEFNKAVKSVEKMD